MQAIVNANIENAQIVGVLSNQADAAGLTWASEHGIHTDALNHKEFASRLDFDMAMMQKIDALQPDLVVLAGFMRILTPEFCAHYENRLFNIHPSLLPSFVGLHTHQKAIDFGCKVAGCTVHFVTAQLDNGPIISQAVVPVYPDDTEETLAQRILKCEHQVYPQAVADFVNNHLQIDGLKVINNRIQKDEEVRLIAQ